MKLPILVPAALLGLALGAASPAWDYRVEADPVGKVLQVEARFAPGDSDAFMLDRAAEPFVQSVERERRGRWEKLDLEEHRWRAAGAEREGAHLRWRLDLDAISKRRSMSLGGVQGEVVAKLTAWLLRPEEFLPERRARLRIALPQGLAFASGLPASGPELYEASVDAFNEGPATALGHVQVRRLQVGAAELVVAAPDAGLPMSEEAMEAWVRGSAQSVAAAYGRFPVKRLFITLLPVGGRSGVLFGLTSGHGGASIQVLLGLTVSEQELKDDWVLAHEMIHTALPDLDEAQHWFEEGIPTYLEPLLRLREGRVEPSKFWADLRRQLPKGQPASGDRGLDRTPTWGRTYWGGALFCFLADLEIREKSGGRRTLLDALRGINATGSIEGDGDIGEVLDAGDRALGFQVLRPLYERMARDPWAPDLEAIWKRLGAGASGFDDGAPEAALRKSWGK